MTMTPPRLLVSAPPFVPAKYGLSSVATLIPETTDHWRFGIQWQSPSCGVTGVMLDPCVTGTDQPPTIMTDCPDLFGADPFITYILDTTSAGYLRGDGEARAWLSSLMDRGEWQAVENYIGTKLAAAATDVSGAYGATPTALRALAAVEQKLAEGYGGTGVIHMSRYAATILSADLLHENGKLVTINGTPVAAGNYPEDAAASVTIFGTGAVGYRRGDVEYYDDASTIDRKVNQRAGLAQRAWVLGWECLAVKATGTVS